MPGRASLASMTGFARTEGSAAGLVWAWELRSVNGRGLDLKIRLPAGFDGLEPGLREAAGRVLRRGTVGANLAVKREERPRLVADPAVLDDLLAVALALAARIPGAPAPRAETLLGMPGVMRPAQADDALGRAVGGPLGGALGGAVGGAGGGAGGDGVGVGGVALEAVRAGFGAALEGLVAVRQEEGARLAGLLAAQLGTIGALRLDAEREAADQPRLQRERMLESLRALLRDQPGLDEPRIAQEVALLAIRADVREELDRLSAHVDAARQLLAEGVGVGRRFDFLVQEFVRETNTLCSKSASVPLTATGLKLKAVIEQMREQVQNVE